MKKMLFVTMLVVLIAAGSLSLFGSGCAETVSTTTTTTTTTTTSISSTSTTTTTTLPTTTLLTSDINGDGVPDVIVGANLADVAGQSKGEAYVHLGGASMDTTSDVTLSGEELLCHFGYSVSNAGDVNGDGFADVIVGAYIADVSGASDGQAYIYFGGAAMDNTADVTFTGLTDGDRLGNSVSCAGDVNRDGFADVIVGAYFAEGGGSYRGQAYIYYGGSSMDNTADLTFTGAADDDMLGSSVSYAGDVNGDGYVDVIVGASDAAGGGSYRGQAYIYYGGSSMDNSADVTLSGAADGDVFGNRVSCAGDVNNDGYDDVIVGAWSADSGGANRGQAYIFYGGASMDATADVTFNGPSDNSYFGNCLSSAGDVNNDGYADVIVGACRAEAGGTDRGQAFVYFGGASMDNSADVTMTGADDDRLGNSASSAGDINGDGYDDVIIGAYNADSGGIDKGEAYIYYGGTSMDNTADLTFTGTNNDDFFGISVSGPKP